MKRFAAMALAAAMLMPAGLSAEQFGPAAPYDASAVTSVVQRVRTDLDHAYGVPYYRHDDRDRLNHAQKEVRDFTAKWNKGDFDKGDLDGAIAAVQHVLDNNSLPESNRDALSYDVNQLRRMREAYDRHQIRGIDY